MTQDEARRQILAQQGLIEPFEEPMQAVRAMVAVQTQYAASLTSAVAARCKKLPPEWEAKALSLGGELVKAWSVRHTLHAHSREDHALVLGILGERFLPRHLKWMRAHFGADPLPLLEATYEALRDGPLSRSELHERVLGLKSLPWAGWGQDAKGLAFQRRLCIVGRGAQQKFSAMDPEPVETSLGSLLRRYLQGFAPVSVKDFRHWAGVSAQDARAAFAELRAELEPVQIDGLHDARYVLKGAVRGSEGSLGVRLLAKFDPLVLAHWDKSLFIPPADKPKVFRIAGQVEAVVLSEGVAIGTWRLKAQGKESLFVVEPFATCGPRTWKRIEKEAAGMAGKLGLRNPRVVERP